MPDNTFFETILDGALFGITVFAAGWVLEKIHDRNEEIEEMLSRLEDFEEKLSRLEDCEKKLSQCKKNHELKKKFSLYQHVRQQACENNP